MYKLVVELPLLLSVGDFPRFSEQAGAPIDSSEEGQVLLNVEISLASLNKEVHQ